MRCGGGGVGGGGVGEALAGWAEGAGCGEDGGGGGGGAAGEVQRGGGGGAGGRGGRARARAAPGPRAGGARALAPATHHQLPPPLRAAPQARAAADEAVAVCGEQGLRDRTRAPRPPRNLQPPPRSCTRAWPARMCQQHAAAAVVGRGGLAEAVPATASADACRASKRRCTAAPSARVRTTIGAFDLASQRSDYRAQVRRRTRAPPRPRVPRRGAASAAARQRADPAPSHALPSRAPNRPPTRRPATPKVEARIRDAKKEIKTDIAPDRAWAQMGLADEPCLTAARAPARAQSAGAGARRPPAGRWRVRGAVRGRRRTPCVLTHLADDWAAYRDGEWSLERLRARYAEARLKVGEDDEGYPVRLKFKYFCYYLFDQVRPGGPLRPPPPLRARARDAADCATATPNHPAINRIRRACAAHSQPTSATTRPCTCSTRRSPRTASRRPRLDDFRVPHSSARTSSSTWARAAGRRTAGWSSAGHARDVGARGPAGDRRVEHGSAARSAGACAAGHAQGAGGPVRRGRRGGGVVFEYPAAAAPRGRRGGDSAARGARAARGRDHLRARWLVARRHQPRAHRRGHAELLLERKLRALLAREPALAAGNGRQVAEPAARGAPRAGGRRGGGGQTVVPKKRKSGKTSGKDEKRKRSHKHDPDHDRERSRRRRTSKKAGGRGTAVGGGGAGGSTPASRPARLVTSAAWG